MTDLVDSLEYAHGAVKMHGRLGTLVTVRDLAKRTGWGYRRMLRHMHAANKQLNGMLLVNLSPKGKRPHYVLALEKLEQLRPEWAASFQGVAEEVEELEGKGEELEAMVVEANTTIGHLKRRVDALETRISKLEKVRAEQ
jgi:septal ring factor EnvC (AmiA/AmiB activator)